MINQKQEKEMIRINVSELYTTAAQDGSEEELSLQDIKQIQTQ
ncbi:hypothetical protein EV142_104305 [Flavobacterium circumlabens]|uniref:Uncharacterized protein n=1 Tax=Flavobacterium circumlabens TaxID=2133765 RepID=A0ABY2AYW5_9FLAO|nr:hypothetical protein EV142_104305 [Flavobacterium circumlabens]